MRVGLTNADDVGARPRADLRRMKSSALWVAKLLAMVFCAQTVIPTARCAENPTGWELLRRLRFTEAASDFERETTGAARRPAMLGQAIALVNKRPPSEERTRAAVIILDALQEEISDDYWGLAAGLLEARLVHFYGRDAKPRKAAAMYFGIFERNPQHWLAQDALVEWINWRLYDTGDIRDRMIVMGELEAFESRFSDPVALWRYHEVLQEGCRFFRMESGRRLDHLLSMMETGVDAPTRHEQFTYLIAVAELARSIGRDELALDYYDRFLLQAQRDNRIYVVNKRRVTLLKNMEVMPSDLPEYSKLEKN